MLKVTLTAINNPVTLQDPRPVTQNNEEQAVITVQPGTTVSMVVQWGQLERLWKQIIDLANLGMLTYVVESAGVASFAEQPDAPTNPAIDLVTGAVDHAGTTATVSITGTNLLAGQVMASASIPGDTTAGSVLLEVLNPSYEGNLYDVEVVDTGSAGLAVSSAVVGGRTVITVNLGASATETCATVSAAIATALAGEVQSAVVGVGATPITSVRALAAFTGGIGSGLSISLAGVACTITAINLSGAPVEVISIDTPAVGVATDVARILLRSNSKEAIASVVLV